MSINIGSRTPSCPVPEYINLHLLVLVSQQQLPGVLVLLFMILAFIDNRLDFQVTIKFVV